MMQSDASWSVTTAIRSVFKSAHISADSNSQQALADARACWDNAPICTSLVVTFWQRYLCYWSDKTNLEPLQRSDPADLILKWMPLKADRTLPGDLLDALMHVGWVRISHFSLISQASQPSQVELAGSLRDVPCEDKDPFHVMEMDMADHVEGMSFLRLGHNRQHPAHKHLPNLLQARSQERRAWQIGTGS